MTGGPVDWGIGCRIRCRLNQSTTISILGGNISAFCYNNDKHSRPRQFILSEDMSVNFWFSALIIRFFQLCIRRTDLPQHGVVPEAPIGTANVAPAPLLHIRPLPEYHTREKPLLHIRPLPECQRWRKATTIRPAQIPLKLTPLSLLSQLPC